MQFPCAFKASGIASESDCYAGINWDRFVEFCCDRDCFIIGRPCWAPCFVVDGIDRRVLSEVLLGALYFMPLSPMANGLALVGLFAFIVFLRWGWVLLFGWFSGCCQLHFEEKASRCLFFNSCARALLASFFLDIQHLMGAGDSYFLFAGSSLCYLLLVYFACQKPKGERWKKYSATLTLKFVAKGDD